MAGKAGAIADLIKVGAKGTLFLAEGADFLMDIGGIADDIARSIKGVNYSPTVRNLSRDLMRAAIKYDSVIDQRSRICGDIKNINSGLDSLYKITTTYVETEKVKGLLFIKLNQLSRELSQSAPTLYSWVENYIREEADRDQASHYNRDAAQNDIDRLTQIYDPGWLGFVLAPFDLGFTAYMYIRGDDSDRQDDDSEKKRNDDKSASEGAEQQDKRAIAEGSDSSIARRRSSDVEAGANDEQRKKVDADGPDADKVAKKPDVEGIDILPERSRRMAEADLSDIDVDFAAKKPDINADDEKWLSRKTKSRMLQGFGIAATAVSLYMNIKSIKDKIKGEADARRELRQGINTHNKGIEECAWLIDGCENEEDIERIAALLKVDKAEKSGVIKSGFSGLVRQHENRLLDLGIERPHPLKASQRNQTIQEAISNPSTLSMKPGDLDTLLADRLAQTEETSRQQNETFLNTAISKLQQYQEEVLDIDKYNADALIEIETNLDLRVINTEGAEAKPRDNGVLYFIYTVYVELIYHLKRQIKDLSDTANAEACLATLTDKQSEMLNQTRIAIDAWQDGEARKGSIDAIRQDFAAAISQDILNNTIDTLQHLVDSHNAIKVFASNTDELIESSTQQKELITAEMQAVKVNSIWGRASTNQNSGADALEAQAERLKNIERIWQDAPSFEAFISAEPGTNNAAEQPSDESELSVYEGQTFFRSEKSVIATLAKSLYEAIAASSAYQNIPSQLISDFAKELVADSIARQIMLTPIDRELKGESCLRSLKMA